MYICKYLNVYFFSTKILHWPSDKIEWTKHKKYTVKAYIHDFLGKYKRPCENLILQRSTLFQNIPCFYHSITTVILKFFFCCIHGSTHIFTFRSPSHHTHHLLSSELLQLLSIFKPQKNYWNNLTKKGTSCISDSSQASILFLNTHTLDGKIRLLVTDHL